MVSGAGSESETGGGIVKCRAVLYHNHGASFCYGDIDHPGLHEATCASCDDLYDWDADTTLVWETNGEDWCS